MSLVAPLEITPDLCLLFLVRHGATANNLAHPPRLQGQQENPPLSADGRAQAQATGRSLAGRALAAVCSSPLLRAQETAAAIAAPHKLTVETVPALIECDIGSWEGRSWEDVRTNDPEAHAQFQEDAGVHPYSTTGENLTQVCRRVAPALESICQRHLGRAVAVAAHNVVNRAFLCHVLGLPLKHMRQIPQDNCGVNVLRFAGGKWTAATINSVWHLTHG